MASHEVKLGDWIRVGRVKAVVFSLHEDRVEIVYLDDRNRAINEDVRWDGDNWAFAAAGPTGGYADNYPRLAHYVGLLRSGSRTTPS